MSKNLCRMLGLILMLVSVFFLLGGLYLGEIPTLPEAAAPVNGFSPVSTAVHQVLSGVNTR